MQVKSLYDVVFLDSHEANKAVPAAGAATTSRTPMKGLRTVIGRGGPMDLGVDHAEIERSRFTVELWVKYDLEAASLGAGAAAEAALVAGRRGKGAASPHSVPFPGPSGHCLLQRLLGPPPGHDVGTFNVQATPVRRSRSQLFFFTSVNLSGCTEYLSFSFPS